MKTIILVAYNLNPNWGSEFGRASAWLDITSKYFQVEVFTNSIHKNAINSRSYLNSRFHFIEIPNIYKWMSKISTPIQIKYFYKEVKKILFNRDNAHVALIHCLTPAGIHAYNDLYRLKLPVVIGPLGGAIPTPKGFMRAFRYQRSKTISREVFYWLLRKRRGWRNYLFNTEKIILGAGLPRYWLPKHIHDKCVCIPDALVNTEYFVPKINKNKNDKVRILYAGRLVSQKGLLILIDSVKLCVQRTNNNFIVELAGFGILKEKIEELIQDNKLEKYIKLLGGLPKDALRCKYQTSDIFCFPSLREPGGNAILEAMACGLPVITSDYGGPALLVTDDCGIKIKTKNYFTYVNDLAEALLYLIENPEVRRRLGYEARKRVENEFSLEVLEQKILNLYRPLTG